MPASIRALQQQLAKPGPEPGLTWGKAWFALPVAAILDLLRFLFVMLVFTAPAAIGVTAAVVLSNTWWAGWLPSWAIGAIAASTAAVAEFIPGLAVAVEGFGILMAIIIGIAGFVLILFILARLGVKLTGTNTGWLFFAFVGGVAPLADGMPSLVPITFHILNKQIKEDKKQAAAYRAEQTQLRAQLQQVQLAEAQGQLQFQAAQEAQAEAEEQADEEERAAREAEEAARAEEAAEPILAQVPEYTPRPPVVGAPSLLQPANDNTAYANDN